MNEEKVKTPETICPHCGELAHPLGQCKNCQNPVCEHCGHETKDGFEHLPDWCWSTSAPKKISIK
jgi:hypothetical protein